MIGIIKYPELKQPIKDTLNTYINIEFGDIPIVRETEWATPDWTIIHFEHGEIASFCNIVEREILIDNNPFTAGGINNVITPQQYRGKGYASKLLSAGENFIFNQLKCELGVLLCANALLLFYEGLNWYKVDCPVYFEQADGEKLWGANTMFLSQQEQLSPQLVKLNGLPW